MDNLNQLQRNVLNLYSDGRSVSEIGEKLNLSELTIRVVLTTVLQTLDARNVAEAVVIYQGFRRSTEC